MITTKPVSTDPAAVPEIEAPRRLWHGGAPGRRKGEWLLPPSETGVRSLVREMSEEAGLAVSQRPDRVYVTAERDLAYAWAGIWTPDGIQHGRGCLYQVEVEPGTLEPDDDLLSLDGASFQTPRARVKVVYDAVVPYDRKHLAVLQDLIARHARAKAEKEAHMPERAPESLSAEDGEVV